MPARRCGFPGHGPASRTWRRGCPGGARSRSPCAWRRLSAMLPRCAERRCPATVSARRRGRRKRGLRPTRRRRRCGSALRRSWPPPSATPRRRFGVDRWRTRAYCAEMDTARVEALLARDRRVILGITGPPGAGKTRLAEEIVSTFDAVHVPMDGFHLADVELRRLG